MTTERQDRTRWTNIDTIVIHDADGNLVEREGMATDVDYEHLAAVSDAWEDYHESGDPSGLIALGVLPENTEARSPL